MELKDLLGAGEVVKATGSFAEKLLETARATAGAWWEPHAIRRAADAEAYATLKRSETALSISRTETAASEETYRAMARLEASAQRQLRNTEAVLRIAYSNAPEEVSPEPVDPDWAARFFREAQEVGNEDMRRIWGRLLAGEIAKPGSFSPRTIAVLATLTRGEAELFERVCSMTMKVARFRLSCMSVTDPKPSDAAVSYEEALRLEAAGLVNLDSQEHFITQHSGKALCMVDDDLAFVLPAPQNTFAAGTLKLSPVGEELARIASWPRNEAYIRAVVAQWRAKGLDVKTYRIVDRLPDGKFNLLPIEAAY